MSRTNLSRSELLKMLGIMGRKNSTSVVLFHSAIAERLGLNVTDYKCIDIIIQRGSVTAGQLAEVTGLTTGSITAVLDRLEKAGFIRRVSDPRDRRKVLLEPIPERFAGGEVVFADFIEALDQLLSRYNDDELATILDFMTATTQLYDEQAVKLRKKIP
jgi:DNA-binding MarR family transcriptional regulator